jgi:hypothetical protein
MCLSSLDLFMVPNDDTGVIMMYDGPVANYATAGRG